MLRARSSTDHDAEFIALSSGLSPSFIRDTQSQYHEHDQGANGIRRAAVMGSNSYSALSNETALNEVRELAVMEPANRSYRTV